jgi:hypothetical protein
MISRTSFTIFKIATVIFGSTAIVFGVKYFESINQNDKLKDALKLDKQTHDIELKEIFNRYDAEIKRNKKLFEFVDTKLNKSSEKKEKLINEVHSNTLLLKKDSRNKSLHAKIDSLKIVLKEEIEENKNLKNQIAILVYKNTELQRFTSDTESLISLTRNLTATNVYANGIKIVSNNIIETKRFSKTEKIKVCFTLLENKATLKGNQDIFIQIINPKYTVINKNDQFEEIGNKYMHYSVKTNIYYDNDELDVCAFVDSDKKDIIKGDYEINIFSGTKLIGNTTFSLK